MPPAKQRLLFFFFCWYFTFSYLGAHWLLNPRNSPGQTMHCSWLFPPPPPPPVSDLSDKKIITRESFWRLWFYTAADPKLNFYLLGKQQSSVAVRWICQSVKIHFQFPGCDTAGALCPANDVKKKERKENENEKRKMLSGGRGEHSLESDTSLLLFLAQQRLSSFTRRHF